MINPQIPQKAKKLQFSPLEFSCMKQKVEDYYNGLSPILCPYLREQVSFTSDGWHHLRYDGSRSERPKIIQLIKFKLLLSYAVDVIRGSGTLQYYRETIQPVGKVGHDGFRKTSAVRYYAFESLDKEKRIKCRVIIRRIGDGNFHFWSIIPRWKYNQRGQNKTRTAGENTAALEDE